MRNIAGVAAIFSGLRIRQKFPPAMETDLSDLPQPLTLYPSDMTAPRRAEAFSFPLGVLHAQSAAMLAHAQLVLRVQRPLVFPCRMRIGKRDSPTIEQRRFDPSLGVYDDTLQNEGDVFHIRIEEIRVIEKSLHHFPVSFCHTKASHEHLLFDGFLRQRADNRPSIPVKRLTFPPEKAG